MPWLADRPNAKQLRTQLSITAILGLALTGRQEAAAKLDEMQEAEVTSSRLKMVIESARKDLETIREEGLSACYQRGNREIQVGEPPLRHESPPQVRLSGWSGPGMV